MQVGQPQIAALAATARYTTARTNNGRFVRQLSWKLSDGLVLVEAILVDVGLAGEDVLARLDARL